MNGVHFGVHRDQNFYKLNYQFFDESQTYQKHINQKGSLLNLFNILRKSIAIIFLSYFDAKHSDTLRGSSHVCCYFFWGGCGQKWPWSFRSWN